ncbi:uncharacterized protein LOC129953979 [Eupeodes corollae]|uniref:uncharacterized protein LOC129953979 n=1 Tax=Eupeodes corollae TaxID=290404 RepID=UPI002490F69E|nr:uncharacterized protein LOC129953979 [Eupeodes corollae]
MDAKQLKSLLDAITLAVQGSTNNASQPQPEVIQLESFNEENESWKIFIKRLENFFCLRNLTGNTDVVKESKRNWLIHAMGAKTLQLLCNLTSPEDPKTKSYDELIKLVKDHVNPAPSVIAEQNRFTKRTQHEGETISNFVADLKKMCKNCDFKCTSCQASTADAHLRQQFISGLRNANWLEKLIQLKEPNNGFKDCVTATLAMESAQKDSKEIQNLQATSLSNYQNQIASSSKPKTKNYSPNSNYCYRCGDKDHFATACKHNRAVCSKCQKVGHVARVCMNSGMMSNNSSDKKPRSSPPAPITKHRKFFTQNQLHSLESHSVDDDDDDEDDEEQDSYYMNQLTTCVLPEDKRKPKKIMLTLVLDGVSKQLELDTGAAVSSMSYQEFSASWPNKQMYKSNVPFRTYTGEIIQPIGYSTMHVRYGNEEANANIYIMPGKVDAIFGREWFKVFKVELPKLNQVSNSIPMSKKKLLHALKAKFSDVFQSGIGRINNFEAKLFLIDSAKPIYIPARKVPYALQDKMNIEIDRLESEGIITKMQYSEWGTPVVPIIKKDGSIRLCADYKITLNKVLKNDHYPIPHVEDIFATSMMGGKIFTTLDLSEAYLHMPMDTL